MVFSRFRFQWQEHLYVGHVAFKFVWEEKPNHEQSKPFMLPRPNPLTLVDGCKWMINLSTTYLPDYAGVNDRHMVLCMVDAPVILSQCEQSGT